MDWREASRLFQTHTAGPVDDDPARRPPQAAFVAEGSSE